MLYLASTSPRRRDILDAAGLEYRAVSPGREPPGTGSPQDRARQRARAKALGAEAQGPPGWILGVDTVVEHEHRELGKPRDLEQARSMLSRLSGAEHLVHTAVCLAAHPRGAVFEDLATARVRFAVLSAERLRDYLRGGTWRGKAGAYGIQDEGGDFASLVAGSLDTVVGLPLSMLQALLARAGEGVRS